MPEDENKIQDGEIKTEEVVLPEVAPEIPEKLKSEEISPLAPRFAWSRNASDG